MKRKAAKGSLFVAVLGLILLSGTGSKVFSEQDSSSSENLGGKKSISSASDTSSPAPLADDSPIDPTKKDKNKGSSKKKSSDKP